MNVVKLMFFGLPLLLVIPSYGSSDAASSSGADYLNP
jgi:hypothetical protein